MPIRICSHHHHLSYRTRARRRRAQSSPSVSPGTTPALPATPLATEEAGSPTDQPQADHVYLRFFCSLPLDRWELKDGPDVVIWFEKSHIPDELIPEEGDLHEDDSDDNFVI
ncbi:hypothetical protein Pmani_011171 [Petrolisthes manimaculis]|uniref:Uncharacterized protein n=1 Tax=Petrolisthes manimaculis TaxID=1843537 RepID=A0AAE1Q0L7_9EUCA|nr:hypothetical protein Pmani_011171 [Petrolisthes manimaculis]